MQYFIGIDGGGTKTDIVLTDNSLGIVSTESSGPSNFTVLGKDFVSDLLTELIHRVLKNSGIRASEITSISAGIAGTGRDVDRKILKNELLQRLQRKGLFINEIIIDTDARAALEGAHSGKPGCILIAGTGSILLGKKSDGSIFRAGGYGRIIGDQGSGYSIGRKAFSLLGQTFDGRESGSALTEIMIAEYKINNSEALIESVYKNDLDISSAAVLVLDAAEKNDRYSLKILTEESEELMQHLSAALEMFGQKDFSLSLLGSLLANDNPYSKMVKQQILKKFPHIKLKSADHPPAIGAILLSGLRI